MAVMYITVPGIPAAQGSKRFVGSQTGRGIMVESSKALAPWRDSVIHAARQVMQTGFDTFTGPVTVDMSFYFPRPKSHYGTGGNANRIKDRAPDHKTSAPDLDKLVRAVCDALTQAGVWRDDSLVVVLWSSKRYANDARCEIVVGPLPPYPRR